MKDTAKRQLRAYVVADGAGLERWGANQNIKAKVKMHNTGQTPAVNVRATHEIRFQLPGPPHDFTHEAAQIIESDLTLGPGRDRTINVKSSGPIAVAATEAAQQGKVVIVFGVITYCDVFGDEHKTRYCQTYRSPYAGDEIVRYQRFGNSAD